VLYLGLIGAVGYGVYYYATEYAGMIAGTGVRIRLLLYLAPIVSGAVLVLFMLKPIVSRRSGSAQVRTLQRDEAPLLFAFVKKLCRLLGAPTPDRLDLDLQINASAGHHMMSSDGNRFVLTIGLGPRSFRLPKRRANSFRSIFRRRSICAYSQVSPDHSFHGRPR
jgi:hypothetical protein